MLFTFRLTADARMPLKSLTDLAHSQMADGMLQANYPSTGVQIIPDFTLFWVLMLREYLRYAGTDGAACEPVRSLTGTMDKALGVFENYMTDSGLIGPHSLLALCGLGAGLAGRRAGRRARGAADRDLPDVCRRPACRRGDMPDAGACRARRRVRARAACHD